MKDELKNRLTRLFRGTDSRLGQTDPEWVEIVSAFSQEEVIAASRGEGDKAACRLTEKERMLCILAALLGCQGLGEFRNMVHAALNVGVEPAAVREVIYQATAYLGIGRVYDFLEAADQVMEQHGIQRPLESQGTVDEDTRFEKGLAKQVELFGAGMAKRQTEGPVLRRNINRWLADNCFGDYNTRGGLNDQEREMITFCFLLAQGGCENQLRGHTAGNFGVGNGKEKLYSVVEQCMPYVGYPRSLNAMNIIDQVAEQLS